MRDGGFRGELGGGMGSMNFKYVVPNLRPKPQMRTNESVINSKTRGMAFLMHTSITVRRLKSHGG